MFLILILEGEHEMLSITALIYEPLIVTMDVFICVCVCVCVPDPEGSSLVMEEQREGFHRYLHLAEVYHVYHTIHRFVVSVYVCVCVCMCMCDGFSAYESVWRWIIVILWE